LAEKLTLFIAMHLKTVLIKYNLTTEGYHLKLTVDRALPVPLGIQLRGMIEYGIVNGELQPGERLPSVRELADSLGVAPMTVSQVYRYLRDAGLIEARTGAGTYVAQRNESEIIAQTQLSAIQERLDALIGDALRQGLSRGDFSAMVQSRLASHEARDGPRRIVMAGMFAEATQDYADAIQAHLGPECQVEACTLDGIRYDEAFRASLRSAELVITFPNRQREIAALLPRLRVVSISFLPSEKTRAALAGLDPYSKLGMVSHFADFLSMLKSGVNRFAPHVVNELAAVLDTPDLAAVLEWSDVVVYSTGAERLLPQLRPGIRAIEYRYGPDLVDLDRTIVPILHPPLPSSHPI
jgi:DNA-binding transcriptional regulator YhcF (GntR family)